MLQEINVTNELQAFITCFAKCLAGKLKKLETVKIIHQLNN